MYFVDKQKSNVKLTGQQSATHELTAAGEYTKQEHLPLLDHVMDDVVLFALPLNLDQRYNLN